MTREVPDEIATLFKRLENRTVEWWGYVNDEHRNVWPRQDELVQKKNQAQKLIEDRLRSSEQRDAEQRAEIERLKTALRELHAVVKGECPSLLDDDSGGLGKLDMEIDELLKKEHP